MTPARVNLSRTWFTGAPEAPPQAKLPGQSGRPGGPAGWGANDVSLSTDFGRTWKNTGGHLVQVSQQKGIVLPDGAIAFTYRCHSWQQAAVAISYDEGRSFDYLLTGPYETNNAFMHGTDEFVVFTTKSHRSDSSAGVYRWVPN